MRNSKQHHDEWTFEKVKPLARDWNDCKGTGSKEVFLKIHHKLYISDEQIKEALNILQNISFPPANLM